MTILPLFINSMLNFKGEASCFKELIRSIDFCNPDCFWEIRVYTSALLSPGMSVRHSRVSGALSDSGDTSLSALSSRTFLSILSFLLYMQPTSKHGWVHFLNLSLKTVTVTIIYGLSPHRLSLLVVYVHLLLLDHHCTTQSMWKQE